MYAWEITNTQDLEICVEELRDEMAEWDARLEAANVEDATAWEHFPEMERVMYTLSEFEMELAERKDYEARYPREQYERDRAKLIADGIDPRCILSYSACRAYDEFYAELERELEIEESYDEAYERIAAELDEFDDLLPELERALVELVYDKPEVAIEVAERDEIIELVEQAETAALVELEQFGCIEFEPQFNWHRKSTPDERGWSRAMLDIIEFEGSADAESLFELF